MVVCEHQINHGGKIYHIITMLKKLQLKINDYQVIDHLSQAISCTLYTWINLPFAKNNFQLPNYLILVYRLSSLNESRTTILVLKTILYNKKSKKALPIFVSSLFGNKTHTFFLIHMIFRTETISLWQPKNVCLL